MNKAIIKLILIILPLLLSSVGCNINTIKSLETNNPSPQPTTLATAIDQRVKIIDFETNYQIKTLSDIDLPEQTTDGGSELIGYYKNSNYPKIQLNIGLSYGIISYTYYFSDDDLILIHLKEEYFPYNERTATLDYTTLEKGYDEYFYYNENKLIKTKHEGEQKFKSQQEKQNEFYLLETAKKYRNILTNQ